MAITSNAEARRTAALKAAPMRALFEAVQDAIWAAEDAAMADEPWDTDGSMPNGDLHSEIENDRFANQR